MVGTPVRLLDLARQALRYVVIGGGSTAVQLGLVWALTPIWGGQRAFLVSWVISTGLSTLGHRWFTFQRANAARFDQMVGYVTSLVSLAANTAGMGIFQPATGAHGAAIVVTINFTIGVARFLILRFWFLGRVRHEYAATPASPD